MTQGGLEIDQVKTLVPAVSPVIVEVGDNELVITPEPETFTHTPMPAVGVFAVIVTLPVVTQTVLLPPAFAIEGRALTTKVI